MLARPAIFALCGLAFGSFLTVVVTRAPHHQSVVTGRSHCPSCQATIMARDNVPVLSYVLLKGRCRHCAERISPEYPLTEIATAVLFALSSLAFPDAFVAALMALFLGILLAVTLTDVHHRLIPNAIMYPSLALFLLALVAGRALGRDIDLGGAAIGFGACGAGTLAVAVISPRGLGMGDVKLAALIGMVLGSRGLDHIAVALGLAVLAGGIGGIVALAAGRSRSSTMPFGPYLAAGGLLATFWSGPIARIYLSLLR